MKKVVSFLLVLVMVASLVACNSNKAEETKTQETQATDNSTGLEPVELTMALFVISDIPADWEEVTAEMNKIIKEKINATVTFVPISVANYMQQIRLMLTSDEKLDLFITGMSGNMTLPQHIADGQVIPLNDLVEQYGQGIKSVLGDFLGIGSVDGQYYAIPTYRDYAAEQAFVIRQDFVDKYNIDLSKIKELEDLEPILQTIKEKEPDIVPFHPGQNSFYSIDLALNGDFYADTLSSQDFFDGVLMDMGDKSLKVEEYFETERYASLARLMRKWFQAGYISKDVTTLTDDATAMAKADKIASFIYGYKPGVELQLEKTIGKDLAIVTFGNKRSTTMNVVGLMHAITRTSKNPERAMMLLNLLYTDPDLINLFNWGIEGKHYEEKADGHIGYPKGVDASNVGYNMPIGFAFGNQALSKVWEGDPLDLWEQMDTFNKDALKSVALGFLFDIEPVKNEYMACKNVSDQYRRAIGTGAVDPDEMIPEFIEKLKASGVDKIVAEKQRQLDEWAKTQGIK